ncbi:LacI family DNA-binding transcriptional regulator [Maribacter sp. 2307UL18-2]|uniref:LacI family DNA-binding transcriptional regulator n=1 Tax=Maribacter sp. 2307UL18-2 TaxID=3386274 RepID=UPI0039BCD56F
MDKKYTIKDIAKLAGVSKGTVDRVLHGRGKVSQQANEKIKEVLKEIDYRPNPIARSLKNSKVYRIFVLLPDPKEDPYWIPANQGIKDAIKEFKPFGVVVEKFFYDPKNRASFLEKSKEALALSPDVLLMAPVFHKESLEVFENCQQQNVLVALFNNYIDIFNNENFIGQDLHQSGRVAASLIDKMQPHTDTMAIVHINEEAHMRQKENGFKEYFEDLKTTSPTIITYSLNTKDLSQFRTSVFDFFKKHPKISAVFITNSKAYHLVAALETLKREISIVGYDLLEENITLLLEGKIDFLIHQKPKQQAYLSVVNLAEHFLFDKPIPAQNLLPIDVITSENVSYYLN